MDEFTLIERARMHDSEAFTLLYDRSVNKIYKYIYYRVHTTTQAEDLTAQTFLKAWSAINNYRLTERPFEAWLFRIAHNLVIDYFRTHHETVSIDDFPLYESAENVEEIAQKHLTSEMLHNSLKSLTDDQRQVILLKFLEGYGTDQIAAIMGRDTGAIRALQHRGLVSLQRVLATSRVMA